MDKNLDDLLDETLKMKKLNFAYTTLDTAVTTIVQISLFLLGGFLILNGNFTIGMFTIFTMYFNMMLGAAKYFFNFGKTYQDNRVSYSRLSEILAIPTETQGSFALTSIDEIEVKGLGFSYAGSDTTENLISNLDLHFTKGNIYGIIGRNGTGKSTLVSLLLGMYVDEKQGEIFYNKIPSKEVNLSKLRQECIGISEQEYVILDDSVEYNIKLDTQQSSGDDEALKILLRILNIDELAERNNNGHKNEEESSPTNFSGGEKQKLSVLRLLLKDPSVMIFDEPTSAMDVQTIEKFAKHLQNIKSDKIIIIITHDSELKGIFDEIMELG